MNYLKKIVVIGLLLVGFISAQAASISLTVTNGTTAAGNTGNPIVTTNQLHVLSITLANTNPNPAYIRFFDSPSHRITNLFSAYTNRTGYQTNIVLSYTNVAGASESVTNLMYQEVQNITAAALNPYRTLWDYTLQTSNTITYTPTYPLVCGYGLMATSGLPVQVTVEYLPLR